MFHHPSNFISAEDVNRIRNTAAEAEQMGLLHPDQLEIVYKNGWFRLLVPRIYSGRQITLSDLVRLQEAISWADGSTGWVVTLCSGAGWFGGFISPEIANAVFSKPQVCLAGSGAASGTAEITSTGYRINGSWKYASGAHHATHITANCIIKKDGEPVLDDHGEPLILPFIFDKKDVTLLPAWKYIGMVATGSDAFEIKDLQVAHNRQFKIAPSATMIQEPLYYYPFLQLAEATLAVNMSGIAIHFMDICEDILHSRVKPPRFTNVQRAVVMIDYKGSKNDLNRLRIDFFKAVESSWQAIQKDHVVSGDLLKEVSITSRSLARQAREIVDRLYPYCGMAAASTDTEINRAWRDLHTASQHALLTFAES